MKIKTLIIDDDDFIRSELSNQLHSLQDSEIEVTGVYSNAKEAILAIKESPPDLIFLDVQMPEINGFEMLDQLDTSLFEVIFITSFNQYAIQAIKYSALDYLLKPLDVIELTGAIDRFRMKTEKSLTQLKLSSLRHNLETEDEAHFKLVIPTKQGDHQFNASEIIRCEADSNYTQLVLSNKRKFLASKTLSDIEEMLAGISFLRIHKSHLINIHHAVNLTSTGEVVMDDQSRVPVSRRRLVDVKRILRS